MTHEICTVPFENLLFQRDLLRQNFSYSSFPRLSSPRQSLKTGVNFRKYTYFAGMTINVSINVRVFFFFLFHNTVDISLYQVPTYVLFLLVWSLVFFFFSVLFRRVGFSTAQNRLLTRFCVRVFCTSVFNGDDICTYRYKWITEKIK